MSKFHQGDKVYFFYNVTSEIRQGIIEASANEDEYFIKHGLYITRARAYKNIKLCKTHNEKRKEIKMNQTGDKIVNFRLDKDTDIKLDNYCKQRGVKKSYIIRRAIKEYLYECVLHFNQSVINLNGDGI